MKKNIIILILNLSLSLFINGVYASETLNIIPDAGTTSVAGLSDNFDDSVWSIYNNQANLGEFDSHIFSLSYKRLMNMFNFINLAGGFNLRRYGYAGIGVSYMDYGSELLTTGIDASTGLPVGGSSFYSYDLLVVGAYGYDFKSIDMSAGIGIKLLQNSIANRDLLYSVFDISVIKRIGVLKIGANLRNVDIGFSSIESLPFNFNVNLLVPSNLFMKSAYDISRFYLIGGVNVYISDSSLEKVYGSLGIKLLLNRDIDLSTGVFIGKNKVFMQFNSLGIGYRINNTISIDYSFSKDSEYTEFTHCFTVQYRLGGSKSIKHSAHKKNKKSDKSSNRKWDIEDLEE